MAELTCPKCGQALPEYAGDTPQERANHCASIEGGCWYVPCDDLACRALQVPGDVAELREAVEHWRRHQYLSGCSHAG